MKSLSSRQHIDSRQYLGIIFCFTLDFTLGFTIGFTHCLAFCFTHCFTLCFSSEPGACSLDALAHQPWLNMESLPEETVVWSLAGYCRRGPTPWGHFFYVVPGWPASWTIMAPLPEEVPMPRFAAR